MTTDYKNNQKDNIDLMFEAVESMSMEIDRLFEEEAKLRAEGKHEEADKVLDEISEIILGRDEKQEEVKEEKKSNKILDALAKLKSKVKALLVKENSKEKASKEKASKENASKEKASKEEISMDKIFKDAKVLDELRRRFEKEMERGNIDAAYKIASQIDELAKNGNKMLVEMDDKAYENLETKMGEAQDAMSEFEGNFNQMMGALGEVAQMPKGIYDEILDEEMSQLNFDIAKEDISPIDFD